MSKVDIEEILRAFAVSNDAKKLRKEAEGIPCPTEENLDKFTKGELAPENELSLRKHLLVCGNCVRRLAEMGVEVPADLAKEEAQQTIDKMMQRVQWAVSKLGPETVKQIAATLMLLAKKPEMGWREKAISSVSPLFSDKAMLFDRIKDIVIRYLQEEIPPQRALTVGVAFATEEEVPSPEVEQMVTALVAAIEMLKEVKAF